MVPPPSALRVSTARRELRLRARPGLRPLMFALLSAPPAVGAVWFALHLSSPLGWTLVAGFAVVACVMSALLWRLERNLRRVQASHPLPADTDPVRLAVAMRQVGRGTPTGDPETDRLGRAMAESIRATHTSGFFRFALAMLVVALAGLWWILAPLRPWDLPMGEALPYAGPLVLCPVLVGVMWLVVLWQERRARAFIAAHGRGAT